MIFEEISMLNMAVTKKMLGKLAVTQRNMDLHVGRSGIEISTHPLAQPSVKTSWASKNCKFFVAFLTVTHPKASAFRITFPTLKMQSITLKDQVWSLYAHSVQDVTTYVFEEEVLPIISIILKSQKKYVYCWKI